MVLMEALTEVIEVPTEVPTWFDEKVQRTEGSRVIVMQQPPRRIDEPRVAMLVVKERSCAGHHVVERLVFCRIVVLVRHSDENGTRLSIPGNMPLADDILWERGHAARC